MTPLNQQFTTIRTEGALLPPDILQRISSQKVEGMRPADYHLPEGFKITEAITQSWDLLKKHWKSFQEARENLADSETGTSITNERWLLPLFQQLGYGRLTTQPAPVIEERSYPIERFYNNTPIHLIGCNLHLDRRTKGARGAATASPHSMVQEYLNRSDAHLWAFLSNGRQLRLLRDNVALSRQAFVEFDLEAMMEGEVYSDFALLWMLCHQSRLEAEKTQDCWLEKWSKLAREAGTRVLNNLRTGVANAIEALGRGFIGHPHNDDLRRKLQESGDLSKDDFYRQLLRIVYRLLFLFVAEDRELLHPPDADDKAKDLYRKYYSTSRLRDMSLKLRGSKHGDLWHSLSLVCASLGKNEGCPQLGLVGLGSFLWNTQSVADLAGPYEIEGDSVPVQIANDDLLTAIRALAFVEQDKVLRSVDYRNLGSEELGSVYESLLELHPDMHVEARHFELRTAAGNERKTTGSYYTPDSLVQCLLDSALDPVVQDRLKGKKGEDAEVAILSMTVCDPACGSGHFLIAAAHRLARHLARVRTGESEPSPEDHQHALRDVIGRCIYGVDINPMAVELCKVSLWMEAIEPGKPLSFLDHHIQCGNSLLGTTPKLLAEGIPDDAFKPIEGDAKAVVNELKKQNKKERTDQSKGQGYLFEPFIKLGNIGAEFSRLTAAGDDTVTEVTEKERRYAQLVSGADYLNARLLADTWCAVFVWQKDSSDLGKMCPTERDFRNIENNPHSILPHINTEVRRLADKYQFFHWHLAFPDVFRLPAEGKEENDQTGWNAGFDVVLGNPPWGSDLTERGFEFCKHLFRRVIIRMTDSYLYFTRQMFDCVSVSGAFGVVLPDGVLYQTDSQLLRLTLLDDGDILLIVNAGDVFEGVSRPAALLSASRVRSDASVVCEDWTRGNQHNRFKISQRQVSQYPGTVFATTAPESYSILEKILSLPHVTLEDVADNDGIQRGVSPDLKDAFVVDDLTINDFAIEASHLKPVLTGGRDIKRFSARSSDKRLIYTTRDDDFDTLPGICSYIDTFTDRIKCKEVAQGKHPIYALHRPRDIRIFYKPQKIVGVITEDSIVVAIDEEGRFATDAVYLFSIKESVDIHFIVGLLNSELFSFLYSLYSPEGGRVFAQVKPTVLKILPIPNIESSAADIGKTIAEIAQRLQGECVLTSELMSQLNVLVYDLFQLSGEERAYVSQQMELER